ncbi:MAG: DUF2069 domain-containing protein [Rugosibacter sp.]
MKPYHSAQWANLLAITSLLSLLLLCLSWELWLAPLHAGGSTLFFKAIPLLFPLLGILNGKRYTHQWTSMLSLAYLTEGIVRATAETGTIRILAILEVVLAVLLFISCVSYARLTAPSMLSKPAD